MVMTPCTPTIAAAYLQPIVVDGRQVTPGRTMWTMDCRTHDVIVTGPHDQVVAIANDHYRRQNTPIYEEPW